MSARPVATVPGVIRPGAPIPTPAPLPLPLPTVQIPPPIIGR
jgi:hypothetical protein